MNVFQYSVAYSLAWLAILADGWLFHTGWIWMLGLLAFAWILWYMYKEMKHGFQWHDGGGPTDHGSKRMEKEADL